MATRVVFRKFKGGDIIAILPYYWNRARDLTSYMRIGQHGPCGRDIVSQTRLATPQEYAPLLGELRSVGYHDAVPARRINYRTLKW